MSSAAEPRRLFLWRTGDVIRSKVQRITPDWETARFVPPFRGVQGPDRLFDLDRIPHPDGAFDVVYARHIIEHVAQDEAHVFANELRRVLVPGGVLRISGPHLERLARNYVTAMGAFRADPRPASVRNAHEHRWFFIDQFVRRVSGGAIGREIVSGRIGAETLRAAFGDALGVNGVVERGPESPMQRGWKQRLKELGRTALRRRWIHETHATREANLGIYDRFSLPKILRASGFTDINVRTADTSAIAGWARWNLDRSDFGAHEFEPSLIIEALR